MSPLLPFSEVKDGGFALGNFAATSTGHIEAGVSLFFHDDFTSDWVFVHIQLVVVQQKI